MKFRKATKKIVAVASAAALASASAFAVPNYPMNFVDNGELSAQVVVGSGAAASDMAAAESIVANLQAMENGGSDMVTINYREAGASGQSVPVRDAGSVVKLGSDLSDVKTTVFDRRDLDVLRDNSLQVGTRNREYTQEIEILAGTFEHSFRDRLESEMSQKIFLPRNTPLMRYDVDFKTAIPEADFTNARLLGKEMELLGQTFTISDVNFNGGAPRMTLLGGSNKMVIGEGDTNTVTVEGNSYDVVLGNVDVANNQVVVSVNGQQRVVDRFGSETIAGINVVVTNLVGAVGQDRSGFAEIILGGNEVLLTDGSEVELNDERITREIPNYFVRVDFDADATEFRGMSFTYEWRGTDGVILRAGESYEDQLFGGFGIRFEGTNDVDYTETILRAGRDTLSVDTVLIDGTRMNREIAFAEEFDVAPGVTNAVMRLIGDNRDVPLLTQGIDFSDNDWELDEIYLDANGYEESLYTVTDGTDIIFAGTGRDIERLFDNASAIDDGIVVNGFLADFADSGLQFLAHRDINTMFLYTFRGFSRDSVDIADDLYTILDQAQRGASDQRYAVAEGVNSASVTGRLAQVDTLVADRNALGETFIEELDFNVLIPGVFLLEREGLLNVGSLNSGNLSSGTTVTFSYDDSDLRLDDSDNDAGTFIFQVDWDASDDEVRIRLDPSQATPGNNIVPVQGRAYVSDSQRDVFQRVDRFGTIVQYDNDRRDEVIIMKPDTQLEANVVLTTGTMGALQEVTVPANQVDARIAELEGQGATILGQSTQAGESVTVNVAAPTMDMDLTEADVAAGNHIVVGGPAVNAAARIYLGIDSYDVNNPQDIARAGVTPGQFVHLFFEEANSIVVYGYSAADTTAAVQQLNQGSANFEDR